MTALRSVSRFSGTVGYCASDGLSYLEISPVLRWSSPLILSAQCLCPHETAGPRELLLKFEKHFLERALHNRRSAVVAEVILPLRQFFIPWPILNRRNTNTLPMARSTFRDLAEMIWLPQSLTRDLGTVT